MDPLGRQAQLHVWPAHRAGCTFGPGLYRLKWDSVLGSQVRFVQTDDELRGVMSLLQPIVGQLRVERDGFCLDPQDYTDRGDARTPDTVDAEQWLALSVADGMIALGLTDEGEYRQTYAAVQDAVYERDNRAAQGGVRASIVLKRKGARVTDIH